MKIIYRIYILIFLLGLTSCNEKQENPILGKWILVNQENKLIDSSYIIFNSSSQENIFISENVFQAKRTGNWKSNENQLTLIYYTEVNTSVDSINVINDNKGTSKITIWKNDTLITEIVNEGLNVPQLNETFDYEIKNDGYLLIKNKNLTYRFQKDIIPQQNISFLSIVRGIGGIFILMFLAWLFSSNRKKINWNLVGKGLLLQIIIAIAVLKLPFVETIFDVISKGFVSVIGYTDSGIDFLFKQFGTNEVQGPLLTFAVKVLPTIIFFSALVSLFYYWGILQKIVYAFAWIMKKFMRLSGAESLAAAGNVFLGQTESPLLVKPYLAKMTKSEIMCLMTGGMATIAGGVLAAYVGFLGGDDPVQQAFFAKHLLTASVISAPAAIIAAKILVPETEPIDTDLSISKEKIGTNALEAITNGTTDGLKLAVNVGAMLLVFIALMALGNGALGKIGEIANLNNWIAKNTLYDQLSFQFLLGYACRPLVWLMGVEWVESVYVGELLGTKTILNEFVAYERLGNMKNSGLLSEKSLVMSTYMLCGFANFASIGIQIGGIGSLIPNRKGLLSQLGIKALIGGTIACLMTSVIVGMLY